MWEEKATLPTNDSSGMIEDVDEKKAFDEINFLSWSSEHNKFINTEKSLLEELKLYEEFQSLIISGSYMDVINDIREKREKMNSQQQIQRLPLSNKNSKHGSNRGRTNRMSKNQASDVELDNRIIKDVEDPDIVLESITSHDESLLFDKDANVTPNTMEHQFITPINITTSASDKTLSSAFLDDEDVCGGETSGSSLSLDLIPSSMPGSSSSTPRDMITGGVTPQPQAATSDEDNVIQGLLEDIRGSFERQFDDEFNFDEG